MGTTLKSLAPILEVVSVADAVAFYCDKLGFSEVFIAESPHLATYAAVHRDGFAVHFIEQGGRDASDVRSGINIMVDDVDALYLEFKERGAFAEGFPRHLDAIREHPPEDKEYGMRDIIFVDPNGYILVFGHPLGDEE